MHIPGLNEVAARVAACVVFFFLCAMYPSFAFPVVVPAREGKAGILVSIPSRIQGSQLTFHLYDIHAIQDPRG